MSQDPETRRTIPENWTWATLSDLGDIVGGGTPSTKEPSNWSDEISWISPADLTGHSKKTIARGRKSISRKGLANSAAKLMPAGSVHFSSRAPIGYVAISSESLATNQGFKSLVPAAGVFNEYVYYFLKASQAAARTRASGTTFLELSAKAFGSLPIPLPPTAAQMKVVAKIEEVFSELDKGVLALKTARAQLNVYRQSLLKHAFEGKLTTDWRKKNKDKLESPEQLLARVGEECEARHKHMLGEWKCAVRTWKQGGEVGAKPKMPRKFNDGSAIRPNVTKSLPALPNGWSYVRLGQLIDGPKYGTSKKCAYQYEGTGVLRIPNIVLGEVDTSDLKGASFQEDERRAYELKNGDILIVRSNGSITLVGRCAVITKSEEQYLFAGYLMRLRGNAKVALPSYLSIILSCPLVRSQIAHKAKSTSGVNNINSAEIQSLVVPICSLSEQHAMIDQLAACLSSISELELEIDSQLGTVEMLQESILKQAFTGQLVPQDPNYEPASVLLSRIRKAKTANLTRVKA